VLQALELLLWESAVVAIAICPFASEAPGEKCLLCCGPRFWDIGKGRKEERKEGRSSRHGWVAPSGASVVRFVAAGEGCELGVPPDQGEELGPPASRT